MKHTLRFTSNKKWIWISKTFCYTGCMWRKQHLMINSITRNFFWINSTWRHVQFSTTRCCRCATCKCSIWIPGIIMPRKIMYFLGLRKSDVKYVHHLLFQQKCIKAYTHQVTYHLKSDRAQLKCYVLHPSSVDSLLRTADGNRWITCFLMKQATCLWKTELSSCCFVRYIGLFLLI